MSDERITADEAIALIQERGTRKWSAPEVRALLARVRSESVLGEAMLRMLTDDASPDEAMRAVIDDRFGR